MIKMEILPNHYLNDDGTFNRDLALITSGHIAGVCYDEEGFKHIVDEPTENTEKRIKRTIENGHHSVYDHIFISFNIHNIPKIVAMIINNEKQYTTSEKSARYTRIVKSDNSCISDTEVDLYNKWYDIFYKLIETNCGECLNARKIRTLAQENARYLVTVFMPTEMVYTTSFRQINYIAMMMQKYIDNIDKSNEFEVRLAAYMEEFITCLKDLNVLDERLMTNDKSRCLSLFGTNIDKQDEYFSDVYSTCYKTSFASLAQAQRHRTIDYKMEMLDTSEYFIPPIIENDEELVKEWLQDIESVSEFYPNGTLVRVRERGTYENFILKCMERLCSAAQLEIMNVTRDTLLKYQEALEANNNPLASDIKKYTKGPRCSFPNFKCKDNCARAKDALKRNV